MNEREWLEMTDQFPSSVGTVAQEAARLIEDMATMARSSYARTEEPRMYADPSDREQGPPSEQSEPAAEQSEPLAEACSMCGAEREGTNGFDSYDGYDNSDLDNPDGTHPNSSTGEDGTREGREIPTTCRICPLCKGIELLRAVRPETVDLLADLALSLATTLRDVAKRSRASDHGSSTSTSGASASADRPNVQDIFVGDETEG
jgi:hypothetical protein